MQSSSAVIAPLRDPRDSTALWAALAAAGDNATLAQAWLALQCRALSARAGLVLWRQADGSFAPVAIWPDVSHDVTYLGEPAREALTDQRGLFRRPVGAGAGEVSRAFIAYPVGGDDERMQAVAVVDVDAATDDQVQSAMRALHWGAGWLQSRALLALLQGRGEELAFVRLAADALALVGEQKDAQGALVALVNALVRSVGAQRVLAGVVADDRVRLRAISSTATFDPRTQAATAVENLMEEALDQHDAVGAPPLDSGTFSVNVAHEEHRAANGLGFVQSVLLPGREGPLGVLTVELDAQQDLAVAQRARRLVEVVAQLVGPLLEDKLELERWVTGRARDILRDGKARLVERGHGGFKLAAMGLGLLFVFLAVARQEHRVTARAVVEGAVQRAAVAPYKGYVASAPVRAGQTVTAGTVLATLDARDLELERARWNAQFEEASQKYRDAMARRERAEAVIFAAQMRQSEAELNLVEEKLARSQITAPIDGLVVAGDLSQMLGTPVETGDTLFEIAPLDAYRVVIQVEDADISYVRTGQAGRMVLTGRPGDPVGFRVRNVTAISEQKEGRNVFRVEAEVDPQTSGLRPGMEGVGKISVGRRSVLWVWTHRFTDWLRLATWRWMP